MAIELRRGGEYYRARTRWWKRALGIDTGRYLAGQRGEASVRKVLRGLSRRYLVIHDLSFPDRAANIDHVVVGPRGVVAIETKYYAAEVRGTEGGEWKRRKRRRGWRSWLPGGWSFIHDPTAQARRGAHRLQARLQRRPEIEDIVAAGRLHVHPLVVFAHPNGLVRIRSRRVPVVDLRRLRRRVKKTGARTGLVREERRRIADAILQLGQPGR